MELSPEERRKIYEEERARIEAEERQEGGQRRGNKVSPESGAGRKGRVLSSSVAIAWSLVFLIFFGFFSRYIAYYQLEKVRGATEWVRYPILTAQFNSWLPILIATLLVTIAAHITLIIFDKYIIRESTLIVLKLFGIATVFTLLSIFPFNFSGIPDTMFADVSPTIIKVVLGVIIAGLGVAALVSLIKLIVSIATRTASY